MAVASPSKENTEHPAPPDQPPSCRPSPSRVTVATNNEQEPDAAFDTSSVHSGEPSDRSNRDVDILTQVLSTRSEEYRLLFRLPPDEVLIQDFNCALQENILLQGHMYLFVHHICFYSNIFGFETKRTIPFHEVTCVRKAKTAGIFPNALEILTGAKKHFFGSFLSRDEAHRLIIDGWSPHNSDAKAFFDCQESKCDSSGQDSPLLIPDGVRGPKELTDWNSADSLSTKLSEVQEKGEGSVSCLSPGESFSWHLDDVDSPKVPEYFTLVAEAKFLVNLEDFFHNFFSDAAAEFLGMFRKMCGDKDFRFTPWRRHEQFGHARDLSFDHPIKIYFGAKFGHCQERQRFRAYRDSHLIIETSQQISDVPYGDYFHVEAFWDVEQDCNEENCCTMRVYINVAFTRKTIWKGKIEQSTKEECHEVYGIWIDNAHELLKQKSLGKDGGVVHHSSDISLDKDDGLKSSSKLEGPSERLHITSCPTRIPQTVPDFKDLNLQTSRHIQEALRFSTSMASLFRGSWATFCSCLKSQMNFPLILVLTFVAILILMQLSTIVLLTKAPEVHRISQGNHMNGFISQTTETIDWLETQIHHLGVEMLIMETRLERMRNEYALLRTHLQDLQLIKHKT